MCYSIYLSTSSQEDLSLLASSQFSFSAIECRDDTEDDIARWASDPTYIAPQKNDRDNPEILERLKHSARWYLHCRYGGCSCHFRHMGMDAPEYLNESYPYFSGPEDWMPEDADDVESTKAVYDALVRLASEGHQIDLIDSWAGTNPKSYKTLGISLSQIPRDHFRFFSGVLFDILP